MGPHYLNRFFTPKSVAIVGASERIDSVGHRLLINMQEAGFKGGLYPVNNKHEQVLGLTAYPDLNAIPEDLDLVIIATPATSVLNIIHQCGEKGVLSVIIISAGFGELGSEGKRLEQEILDYARRYNSGLPGLYMPYFISQTDYNRDTSYNIDYGKKDHTCRSYFSQIKIHYIIQLIGLANLRYAKRF